MISSRISGCQSANHAAAGCNEGTIVGTPYRSANMRFQISALGQFSASRRSNHFAVRNSCVER